MRVYILGMDGYLGWPLRAKLKAAGHQVEGCDNLFRRHVANSLVPLDRGCQISKFNIAQTYKLKTALDLHRPDVVVHLAEIPSAPYSMRSVETAQITQGSNLQGTLSVIYAMKECCPDAHLVKLGSMGEYLPSSWYHLGKVHDSINLKWACENWGMRVTDIMQGPVYGVGGRFDYDEAWGTVINRWVCMGLASHPLLVYGDGRQVRGFLPIHDSMECFRIVAETPPGPGEYRVVNQYAAKYSLVYLADVVSQLTGASIKHIDNPRKEKDFYEGDVGNGWLIEHGYQPSTDAEVVIRGLIEQVKPFANQIDVSKFAPAITW